MARPYNSVLVAEYLQSVANENRAILNVTKTQKLLYILYGWFWAKHDCQILDESPRAWPYGPVFPQTREKANFSVIQSPTDVRFATLIGDIEFVEAVAYIVKTYSKYSANKLSTWSHSKGGPWDKATQAPFFKWNDIIADADIKEYFKQINL